MSQPAKLLSEVSLFGLVAVGATNAWGHSPLLWLFDFYHPRNVTAAFAELEWE